PSNLSSHSKHPMHSLFTAENSALLLIDHQVGTMQLIKNLPLEVVKRNAIALAKTAKILNIPVILTSSQEGNAQGPLIPELQEILPGSFANRIQRAGIVNAWNDQKFKAAVLEIGRQHLIMAGVTTDVCLVFPAIQAVAEGYQVQAVMDASGSPFDLSEEMSRRRMADAGVVLTTTNTLMAELAQDWSSPHGAQLLQILFEEVLPTISQ
ncbi:MAG: isochorismatase family protein, partial [Leptolyngbya sp.]|nr:isochorismatase family protein [Leptolyngbya sp.]